MEVAGTADSKEAKRLARPILDQWEREFSEVRKARIFTDVELTQYGPDILSCSQKMNVFGGRFLMTSN